MRNRLFRTALIGALCAYAACTPVEQSVVTGDQRVVQSAVSTPISSISSLRASSEHTVRADHYDVPPDYDSNVALHPYTSGLGPCPQGGPGKLACHSEVIPASRYNQ